MSTTPGSNPSTGSTPQGRDVWLDVTKGLTMVGVVAFHAAPLAVPDGPRQAWHAIGVGLFTFIMPVFFIISGMLSIKHLQLDWPTYLRRRVWPIFYLWLVWGLVYGVLALLTGSRMGGSFVKTVTLETPLWYLFALTLYLLAARATRSVDPRIQLAVAAVIAIPPAILLPFDAWGLGHTPHFYVAFLVGLLLPGAVRAWSHRLGATVVWFATSGAVLLAVVLLVPPSNQVVYAITPVATVPMILALCRKATRSDALTRGASLVGRESLAVFVVHPLLFTPAYLVLNGVGSPVAAAIFPVVAVAFAVPIGLFVGLVLGPRLPWLFAPPASRGSARRTAATPSR